MFRLILLVCAVSVAALGCGKDKTPGTGGRNSDRNSNINNDDDDDMQWRNFFPDATITDADPPRPDMPVDMNTNSDVPDASPPDMMQPDAADMPDIGPDADMTPDMPPLCPGMNRGYAQACRCNQECLSNVCDGATANSDGVCTEPCTARSDCPAGSSCVPNTFGDKFCRPDDTGSDCDAAGTADPSGCSAGFCLEAGSNFVPRHYCSVPCESSGDCMMGHACSPVRCQTTAEGQRCKPTVVIQRDAQPSTVLSMYPLSNSLCIPIGATNPCGAATMDSDQAACAGAMCDAAPSGRCTAQCETTADCPAGGCADVDLSNPLLPIRACDL